MNGNRVPVNARLSAVDARSFPTVFVAGTVRGATTSLHYYLDQHPGLAMSTIKEPNFFLFDEDGQPLVADRNIVAKSVRDRAAYEALFRAKSSVVRGEASPLYLYTSRTPELIAAAVADARVLAVLRDPVDRAWSHFLYVYKGEPAGAADAFRRAIADELTKPDRYEPYLGTTHFLRLGRYAEQVRRYHKAFGTERVLLLEYAELAGDTASTLAEVCRFVGVDDSFAFDLGTVHNQSGVASKRVVRSARAVLGRVQPHAKRILPRRVVRAAARARSRFEHRALDAPPALPADLRAELREWYADDVATLEALVGREFPGWRPAAHP